MSFWNQGCGKLIRLDAKVFQGLRLSTVVVLSPKWQLFATTLTWCLITRPDPSPWEGGWLCLARCLILPVIQSSCIWFFSGLQKPTDSPHWLCQPPPASPLVQSKSPPFQDQANSDLDWKPWKLCVIVTSRNLNRGEGFCLILIFWAKKVGVWGM